MKDEIQIHGDHPFAHRLRESMRELRVKERIWSQRLINDGIKAAHPNDGWVDRKRNKIKFVNPYFLFPIDMGDRIAIGNPDDYRIVRLTEYYISKFFDSEEWTFEEIERVIPNLRAIKELLMDNTLINIRFLDWHLQLHRHPWKLSITKNPYHRKENWPDGKFAIYRIGSWMPDRRSY